MSAADLPPDEAARLATLSALDLLDTPPEQGFDDIVALAAHVCDVPIALVSLVDDARQWFKAKVGLDAKETPRDVAFCAHAILAPARPLVVPDASKDPRFRDNPLVTGGPRINFYAGMPLVVRGSTVGTLCVIDTKARELTAAQFSLLERLARQAVALMDLRGAVHARDSALVDLAAARDSLEELLDNASDLVQRVSPEGKVVYANRAWRTKLGYDDADLAQMSVFEMIEPAERAHCSALFEKIAAGEEVGLLTTAFVSKSGRVVRVEGAVGCQRDVQSGRCIATRGIFRDVSDIWEERKLRELFSEVVFSVGMGVCAYELEDPDDDASLRLIAANPAAVNFTGVPASSVIGKLIDECWPSLRATGLVARFAAVARGGPSFALPRTAYTDERSAPGVYEGEVFGIPGARVGVAFTNVSDLARLEADASERAARLNAVVETAQDAIITADEAGVIQSFNPAAERMFERSAKDAIGENLRILMPEPYRSAHDGHLARYKKTRVAHILGTGREVTCLRSNGVTFPAHLSVSELSLAAGPVYSGIVRDLTSVKQAELAKDEFVSTVSHELRTPLTSLRGALGLIEGGVAGPVSDQARMLVGIARSNADRLIRLINDLLDLSRVDAGRLRLRPGPCDPASLVRDAVAELASFAAEHGVTIAVEVAVSTIEVAPRCFADRDRILQVLVNLLSNAVKFSPKGADVSLRVAPRADAIRFEVRDTGPGIPAEQRDRLFGRFQQLDASDRRRRGGTGLGLSISKAIVELHGGTIDVESEPAKGSMFFFELPLPSDAAVAAAGEGAARSAAQTTALVVARPGVLGATLAAGLAVAGCDVASAASVRDALSELDKRAPDLLVLDVTLPDGSGAAVLAALGGMLRYGHTRVALVSAGGDAASGPLVFDWLHGGLEGTPDLRAILPKPAAREALLVLVVDDDDASRAAIASSLRQAGCRCLEAVDGDSAARLASAQRPDLMLLDLGLARVDAFSIVDELRGAGLHHLPLAVYAGRPLDGADVARIEAGLLRSLANATCTPAALVEAVQSRLLHDDESEERT